MLVKGFPFSVVYEDDAEGVFIHAIAPFRRRPDYWVGRVRTGG